VEYRRNRKFAKSISEDILPFRKRRNNCELWLSFWSTDSGVAAELSHEMGTRRSRQHNKVLGKEEKKDIPIYALNVRLLPRYLRSTGTNDKQNLSSHKNNHALAPWFNRSGTLGQKPVQERLPT